MTESHSVPAAGSRSTAFAVLVALFTLAAAASRPSAQQPLPSTPMFRTGVSLVLVDVVVRDKKTGRLVTDLTKDDFSIDDEGAPQTIATFASVDLPTTTTTQEAHAHTASTGAGRGETNGQEGRVILFLVDDTAFRFTYTGYLRDFLHRYVDGHMADGDEVSIWTVTDFLPRQGFTKDRARLDKIIDQLQGTHEIYERHLPYWTLATLDNVATALGRIRGRRKVIVFLGGLNRRLIGTVRYEETVRDAAAANVAIYPVSPIGVTGSLQIALNIFANETGGRVFDRNDFDNVLDEIEEEAGTYYMLGFTPTETDERRGHLRRIHVRVDRPDVSVLVRMRYAQIPKDQVFDPNTAPLREVVESALPTTALPLRADATAFAGVNGHDDIVITMRAEGPPARLSGHLLKYVVTGLDQHGDIVASDEGASRVPSADFPLAVTVVSSLQLKPGMRTVKAALQSDDGLVGSVFLPVDVPKLESDDLTLSDVAITSPAERTLVIGRPPAFLTRKLPHPPTLSRRFPSDGTFEIYGEVYGSRKARQITALATLRTAAGAVKRNVGLELEPIPETGKSDRQRFRYEHGVDLYGLADGDYTLEIDAKDEAGHSASEREPFSIGAETDSPARGQD